MEKQIIKDWLIDGMTVQAIAEKNNTSKGIIRGVIQRWELTVYDRKMRTEEEKLKILERGPVIITENVRPQDLQKQLNEMKLTLKDILDEQKELTKRILETQDLLIKMKTILKL